MKEKLIYKEYVDKELIKKFQEYKLSHLWNNFIPKEIIKSELKSDNKSKIDYFEFESIYCGNSILEGNYNSEIKDLFFLYNENIDVKAIYIDQSSWYIFFHLDHKKYYFICDYVVHYFEEEKREYMKYLLKKHKDQLTEINQFIYYLQINAKKIILYPENINFPRISTVFSDVLKLEFGIKKYDSLIINEILNLNLEPEKNDDFLAFLILWNSSIIKFKEKLSYFIRYLLKFNHELDKKEIIVNMFKTNTVDFIIETSKYIYGILFFEVENAKNKKVEHLNGKNVMNWINDSVYVLPDNNEIIIKELFNFKLLSLLFDKIKYYKNEIKKFNKVLPIKFIVVFNDLMFDFSKETIEKIGLKIKENNTTKNYKLDKYFFLTKI